MKCTVYALIVCLQCSVFLPIFFSLGRGIAVEVVRSIRLLWVQNIRVQILRPIPSIYFFFSFSFVYLFCFLVSEGIVGSAPLLLCRVQALFSYHHISSFWHTTLRFSYARTDAMTFFPIDKWISVKDDLSCGCSGCACRREWEREIERKISVRIHTNCVLLRLGAKMSSLASLRMNQLSNAIP